MAAAVFVILLISVLGAVFGPGGFIIFWLAMKSLLAYSWKFLAPLWILLKSKNPWKIAAIALTFASFILHFYSFLTVGDASLLLSATNALAATITGSLQEIITSAPVLVSPSGLDAKMLAVFILFMASARIYLYFVAWRMLKNRVPELAYYLLVFFTFYLLNWGSQDANALFEAFNLAQSAADQAASEASQHEIPGPLQNISMTQPNS